MKMVMEKSLNIKNWSKVVESCYQSWNFTNFAKLYQIYMFFATNEKLRNDVESLQFPTFSAKNAVAAKSILPILDYSGFLLISCTKGKKHDLQVMQNDVLRFCENKRLEDRVSIELLHKNANLISLEQRRTKQLLILMYKKSKSLENRALANRPTRMHNKYVFKTENRVGTKYSNNPYYKGSKLWDKLTKDTQDLDSMTLFKKYLDITYRIFDDKFAV